MKKAIIILVSILVILGFFSFLIKQDYIQEKIIGANTESINLYDNILEGVSQIDNFILTYQENKVLTGKLKELEEEQDLLFNKLLKLEAENELLKSEMQLSNLSNYELVFTEIIYRANSSWNDYFVINKGSNDDIAVGDTVVAQGYLVGDVIEVNENDAKVEFYTAPHNLMNIGIFVETTDANLNSQIIEYNKFSGELIITPLSASNNVKVGDTVYTNGLDGIFPKGIKVGTVTETIINDQVAEMEIIVKTGISLANISFVTVIK